MSIIAKTCSIEKCDNKTHGRGWCKGHYDQWRHHGHPLLRVRTNEKHGRHLTSEYKIWHSMKDRCYNLSNKHYYNYGGRGIKVCDRWLNSFNNFLDDMGLKPEGMSIDRKENDKGYSPENCRWATRLIQSINRRTSIPSSSGYRGVRKLENRWQARVHLNKQEFHFGYHSTPEEAAYVRDQAALQLQGDVAMLNFDY